MDIYRIWKVCAQGDLERLLALSGTSYKWLSHRGVHPSSGPIIQLPKRRQVLYHWKGIFEENPTPYVTKDEDYSLWKTSAIPEIAPLGSFWRYLEYVKSGFFLSGRSPSCPGRSPSVWHRFG